jgi:SH3-like domain-containing protein
MKNIVWTVACAMVISLCAAIFASERLEITGNVRMRVEPDNSAASAGVAPKGAVVSLVEQQGSWYKIEHNGAEGWIFSKFAVPARSNAGEIFTKQDISALPPVPVPEAEAETKTKYAMILKDNTIVRAYLDPYAPFIHKARRGEVLVLIGEGASWCKVAHADTAGWVKCSEVDILDARPTTSTAVKEAKTLFIVIVIAGALILAFSGIMTYRHILIDRKRKIYVQKTALLMAKESKHVNYVLTNTTAPMEHCFSEIGFDVSVAKDSVTARNGIEHNKPDLILVDWDFEPSIFAKVDNLFARMTLPGNPHFIFYNVPDPSAVPAAKALRNVSFLGPTVTDRDIFKVVTPLIVQHEEAQQSPKDIQKSVQRCALEGEIAGGNLLEVLQFIEIGSKTGCLMVETKGPFGLVYFNDGMITYAAAAKGQGVDAVYAILDQPFGKFRFITNKQPKTANLCLPTLSVLMEWTRVKDEARKGRG